MSHNMSYCRWQNTAGALRECAWDLEERTSGEAEDPLSADERRALLQVMELCSEMLGQIGYTEDGAKSIEELLEEVK
jgi:hypothetical protein